MSPSSSAWRALAAAVLAALVLAVAPAASAQDEGEPPPEPFDRTLGEPAEPVSDLPAPGTVTAYGAAGLGDDVAPPPPVESPAAVAARRDGTGWWIASSSGQVTAAGRARDVGDLSGVALNQPVVGAAATPSGEGYWLVASDGGVFAFGDAVFLGSMGGVALNQPVVGMAATPSGEGYWLVASDGGVFAFGDAVFLGSMGGVPLNQPVVGIAATVGRDGYWLVASDGGVFAFGDAPFVDSTGSVDLPSPAVALAGAIDTEGYWLALKDGTVIPFGVPDLGSPTEADEVSRLVPTVDATAVEGGYVLLHGEVELSTSEDGPAVLALQERLAELGYWAGPLDGRFGELTRQAVYAFEKHEGLTVDGIAAAGVVNALRTAERPVPRSTDGDLVEVDTTRQLVYVVRDGRVLWTFNTSTGTEGPYRYGGDTYLADTPRGHFTIDRQIDGLRVSHLGRLHRPKYLVGGIALHGSSFVPPYPDSHGCIRLSRAAMDLVWGDDLAPLGSEVWVYGTTPPV